MSSGPTQSGVNSEHAASESQGDISGAYGLAITLDQPFDDAVKATRAALSEQGFGVLSEIDVSATMKAKLDENLPPYLILGACNPPLAHRAITTDPSIGLLLPCNVVVRAITDTSTVIEAIDPQLLVSVTNNTGLSDIAEEAGRRLNAALSALTKPRIAQ